MQGETQSDREKVSEDFSGANAPGTHSCGLAEDVPCQDSSVSSRLVERRRAEHQLHLMRSCQDGPHLREANLLSSFPGKLVSLALNIG